MPPVVLFTLYASAAAVSLFIMYILIKHAVRNAIVEANDIIEIKNKNMIAGAVKAAIKDEEVREILQENDK